MNAWLIAAVCVLLALGPCAWMSLRGDAHRRLVGVEMTGTVAVIAMMLWAIGSGRPSLMDLPLALGLLSFGGGLIFVRFLEKHL